MTTRSDLMRDGLTLSNGERLRVYDALVLADGLYVAATGWRSAAVVKAIRFHPWPRIAYVGLSAGWFEFAWWQFLIYAGTVGAVFNLSIGVLAFRWYLQHIASSPGINKDQEVQKWSYEDRSLATQWLEHGGLFSIFPVKFQSLLLVFGAKRIQTFLAWFVTRFCWEACLWGSVMWLTRMVFVSTVSQL